MESISLKLDETMLHNIDKSLKKNNFSTRTELIRESIRDKLRELEKEKAIRKLENFFGAAKTKVNDKRLHEIREEVGRKYAKKFGIKLD